MCLSMCDFFLYFSSFRKLSQRFNKLFAQSTSEQHQISVTQFVCKQFPFLWLYVANKEEARSIYRMANKEMRKTTSNEIRLSSFFFFRTIRLGSIILCVLCIYKRLHGPFQYRVRIKLLLRMRWCAQRSSHLATHVQDPIA